MGFLIGTDLVRPEKIGGSRIFCPYEKQIQSADHIRITECLTLLMMPVLPISKISDLKCSGCGKRVISNSDGKYSRNLLLRNIFIGLIGLLMLAVFGYWCIDMPKAFDPNNKSGVRMFFGFFAGLGLIIVLASIISSLKQRGLVVSAGSLDKEAKSRMLAELQIGDGVEKIKEKLGARGIGDLQVDGLLNSWVAPDDLRYASGDK